MGGAFDEDILLDFQRMELTTRTTGTAVTRTTAISRAATAAPAIAAAAASWIVAGARFIQTPPFQHGTA